jgi:hypothetical protein
MLVGSLYSNCADCFVSSGGDNLTLPLNFKVRASVFSIGDTERFIVWGRERHTTDAQVITGSSR